MAPIYEVVEAHGHPGGREDDIFGPPLFPLHNIAEHSGDTEAKPRRHRREGAGGGRAGGGERIATVITNKNHLSHLCNLFSFNIRSMLKRSGSLSEDWEGQALGHSQSSPGLHQQEGIIFKPTCTLTLHWTHNPHRQRRPDDRQHQDHDVCLKSLHSTS